MPIAKGCKQLVDGAVVQVNICSVARSARPARRTRPRARAPCLHERNRFVHEAGRWYYVDGVTLCTAYMKKVAVALMYSS